MRAAVFASLAVLALGTGAAMGQSLPTTAIDCLVKPDVQMKLGSPVNGILGEVAVERGDFVKAGQYLGQLQSGVEEVSVELARARAKADATVRSTAALLEVRERQYKRARKLRDKKIGTDAALEDAEFDRVQAQSDKEVAALERRLAQLELARAEAVLEQRRFRSPIDGVVVERSLSVGEFVFETTPLMTIARIDPLRVEAFVPLAHYGSIKKGKTAMISMADPIGGEHQAKVVVVDRVLDAASGTFGVVMELPNPDRKLPAGVRCTARFQAQ